MMLKNKKAVIFDLDGTLLDSMWFWRQIDIDYLGSIGKELPDDLQASIAGMSFSETAVYFKERFEIKESLEEIKAIWNRMAEEQYRHVVCKPGALQFVQDLKKAGIKTGIATSNSMELAKTGIEAAGLLPYLDEIHTSCEVKTGKPAPDIYLHVANCLSVAPEECLVFEDIKEGLMAGKAAGMTVCAVEDAFSASQKEEKKQLADYYIASYDEISRTCLENEDGL